MTNRLEELKTAMRHQDGGGSNSNYILGLLDLIEYTKDSNTKLLEIGSYQGISTEAFLLSDLEVTAIDPLTNGDYSIKFLLNCFKYPKFKVIKGYSPEDLLPLEDSSFDACYIDGEHDGASVSRDLKAGIRLVKPSGWICGHDFSMVCNEVMKLSSEIKQFDDDSWCFRNKK